MSKTLGEMLNCIPVRGKHTAVVGPNYRISDDASLLYFCHRARSSGTVTAIDVAPHNREASHGNIYTHYDDISIARRKGIPLKLPVLLFCDIADDPAPQRTFDTVYECGVSKCVLNDKYRSRRSSNEIASRIVNFYHAILNFGGKAVIVYSQGLTGEYDPIKEQLDGKFSWKEHVGVIDSLELRQVCADDVRKFGRRGIWDDEVVTAFGLTKENTVRFGSNAKMNVIVAKKV